MKKIIDALNSKGKYHIAFVGDSLTSCEWVHPNWREIVEYVLKEELQKEFGNNWRLPSWGIRCFNFGFDGSTTKDILEKISNDKFLMSSEIDLRITMIGANDPILGVSIEEHKENMKRIKDSLEILATDIKPNNIVAAERYRKYVETDKDVVTINMFEEFNPEDRFFTFISEENLDEGIKEGELDYWHPNQLGNAYIAKIVLEKLFEIKFDPEKYIETNLKGYKYPEY